MKNISNEDISNYCIVFLDFLPINNVLRENVLNLLEVGENKTAIELLCDCMYEDKIIISKIIYIQLCILCYYLNIDETYLEYLFF